MTITNCMSDSFGRVSGLMCIWICACAELLVGKRRVESVSCSPTTTGSAHTAIHRNFYCLQTQPPRIENGHSLAVSMRTFVEKTSIRSFPGCSSRVIA